MGNLKLSEEEIRKAFKYQKENGIWNFYDERAFVEQLLCTRFNYFLVMVGIFLGAALSAKSDVNLKIILTIGFVCILLMALIIYRVFKKLIVVLRILYRLGDRHVFPVIGKEIRAQKDWISFPVNPVVGVWMPFGAVVLFLAGMVLAFCGVLKVPCQ